MAGQRELPNVVLIVVDDLGYGELGCQGNREIPTPWIDSIAREGVRFTAGYVSAPVCSPSRPGFLTGRYQTRFGHEYNAIGRQNLEEGVGLPLEEQTLAELLKAAGYRTGLIGKWHLGGSARYHPLRRGFEEFFGFLNEGHTYVPPPYEGVISWFRVTSLPEGKRGRLWAGNFVFSTHMGNTEPDYDDGNPILRGYEPVRETEYLTTALAREAVEFIRRHRAHPFFLYLAFNAPHSPMQAPVEKVEHFKTVGDVQRRIFAGMVSSLDDAVGKVLKELEELGLERQTLVIFFSDNGGPTRELTSSNQPLRGEKGQLYEGGVRVPFLMRWPGKIRGGRVYERPVMVLDVVPTVLRAAGLEVPNKVDGVALLPYINGIALGDPHEALYWRYGQRAALRWGRWKIVREGQRKSGRVEWELYDLESDIGERNNLAEVRPEVVGKLAARWEEWNREMVPARWKPSPSVVRENWPLELIGRWGADR